MESRSRGVMGRPTPLDLWLSTGAGQADGFSCGWAEGVPLAK
jgi:hypothetical protein